jgi:GT2 family glycosyltransferase
LEKRTDYVLILNNDVSFGPDLLTQFVDGAERWPQAGIFTPVASYRDGSGRWWATAGFSQRLTNDYVALQPKHIKGHQPVPVDYVFGTAMFLRAEVLQQAGLFDERFFMYYEDMDLCLRAKRKGFCFLLLPDIQIEHAVEASTQNQPAQRYYYKARSSVLFFRKHTQGVRAPLVFVYRLLSALKRTAIWVAARKPGLIRGYLQGLWHGWRQAGLI